MIDGISAVTLGTHELPRAVRTARSGLRSCMRRRVVIHQLSSRDELSQSHRSACRAALVLVGAAPTDYKSCHESIVPIDW